jgi:hypothetical protein
MITFLEGSLYRLNALIQGVHSADDLLEESTLYSQGSLSMTPFWESPLYIARNPIDGVAKGSAPYTDRKPLDHLAIRPAF